MASWHFRPQVQKENSRKHCDRNNRPTTKECELGDFRLLDLYHKVRTMSSTF